MYWMFLQAQVALVLKHSAGVLQVLSLWIKVPGAAVLLKKTLPTQSCLTKQRFM